MPAGTFRIHRFTLSDRPLFAAVVAIFHDTGGDGAIDETQLERAISYPDYSAVFGAFDGDRLVGVALAGLVHPSRTGFLNNFSPGLAEKFQGVPLGQLNSVGVLPTHQGTGIGAALGRRRLEWLRERGCRAVVAISWENGRRRRSGPVLRRLGFTEAGRVENFYREAALKAKTLCPVCGRECSCAAVLFTLRLEP